MSLKTVAQFTSGGGNGSGTVTSVNVSGGTTGLTTSGGPVTTSGTITLAGTLAVANGGTGVTASSGASSVVLRDANSNITANSLFEGFTSVAATGTTTTLTAASTPTYVVTGSGGQTYKLPDATTLPAGAIFSFNNNQTSGTVVVQNSSGTTLATLQSGAFIDFTLLVNSPAAGTWDTHAQTPSNVSWSTNTLDWTGSITSATWNGVAVAPNRGGTGIANNTASTLTISGSFGTTFTITGTTSVTLPTSGTLVNTAVTTLSSLSSIGTIATGVWNGTVIGIAYGGTGLSTTPANGALDIGNGTGFTRTTLTAGTNIAITNGSGSISVATSSTPTFTTLTATTVTSPAATALTIQSAGTTAMTIDTGQNVVISNNLLVGQTSSQLGQRFSVTSTGTWNTFLYIPNGQQGFGITNASGTASYTAMTYYNNGTTYSFCGSITVSGTSTAFNTSSDYRMKENVASMTNGLATIAALKPIVYDWISTKEKGEGFLAHELQAIIPLAVTGEKDAVDENGVPRYQGIDYSKIVVYLVAAIQELSAKNDALEARLTALEAK